MWLFLTSVIWREWQCAHSKPKPGEGLYVSICPNGTSTTAVRMTCWASSLVLRGGWEAPNGTAPANMSQTNPHQPIQVHEWTQPTSKTRDQNISTIPWSVVSHWGFKVVCYTEKASWYITLKPQLWKKLILGKNWLCTFAIKCSAGNGIGLQHAHLAWHLPSILCPQVDKEACLPACSPLP